MINTRSFVNRLCGVQNIDGLSNDSSRIGLDVRLRRRGVGRVLHADRRSLVRKIPNRSADGSPFMRCTHVFPPFVER